MRADSAAAKMLRSQVYSNRDFSHLVEASARTAERADSTAYWRPTCQVFAVSATVNEASPTTRMYADQHLRGRSL